MKGFDKRKRTAHFVKFVKGVSTVVAVLLMIAIAVIASLVAYFWVTGYFKSTSTKISKAIQIENAYYTGQYLGVYVQNIGQGKATLIANQCLYVDGALRASAGVNPGKLQQASYTLQESDIALVVDAISLNLGQTIKIKIVTSEGTFVGYSFTINTFQGQNPYSLALIAIPPAGGSVAADNTGPYSYGDVVELTANPAAGWSFSAWSGDASGSTNPTSIVINGTNTVTATFTQSEYALTLDIVGGGSVSKFPDQATYHYGDSVQLQANAASGWTFSGWSGDLTGTTNPSSVVIDETPEVTATFTQNQYTLTVNVDPLGSGSVSRNNTGPYSYGDVVELTANPAAGWSFSGWSQDLTGSANPATILIDGNKAVTATFVQSAYTLTVTVDPLGSGSVSRNNTGPYSYGDVVELTANPAAGWSFSTWSGDLGGSNNPANILIDGDKTVNATFVQTPYSITVNINPPAGGSVTPDKAAPYYYGDVVTLTESANLGYAFSGWSDDGSGTSATCQVTVTRDMTVTASFTLSEYSITVNINPPAGGSVTPDKAAPYYYGDVVTLTESANLGYTFSGWSGDGVDGPGNTRVVTVTGNMVVTATFTQNEYTISVTVDPSPAAGTVTPDVAGPYHYGDVVTLSESPAVGYTFSGWSGDGVDGPGNTRVVTVTGNMVVTATFILTRYTLTVNVVGSGSVTKSPDLPSYTPGTVVNLTAVPANGSRLSAWSGDLTGSANPTSITMNSDKTVTATFVAGTPTSLTWYTWPDQVTLGDNFQSIGILSPGLNGRPIIVTFTRPDGTKIVTTTTTFWLLFNGVFYASTTPDVVGTWTVTAQFLGDTTYGATTSATRPFQVVPKPQYTVSFRQTGTGVAPTVTYHIDSGSDQQGTVPFDVLVDEDSAIYYTYQATVPGASGIQYVLTGTSPSSPETITSAETITGTYKTQYYVAFAVNPSGAGTINRATGWFDSGSLSITATAGSGYTFSSWGSDTGSITFANSGSSSTTATIGGPGTITANFAATTSTTLYPTSIQYTTGSYSSGALSDMQSDNSVYYVSSSSTSGSSRRLDYYGIFTAPAPGNRVVQLVVTLNGHYSSTRTQTLYLYNFATASWAQFDSNSIGTSDETRQFTVTSGLNNYVSATNEIRVRIYTSSSSSTFTHSNDYFKIDITYIP